MPFLEVMHLTGEIERRDLDKKQPVTIGSHKTNDIRIDEDDVEIMHCRIIWGKGRYEATAAGSQPIELNGTAMQQAPLAAGDVLRFGTVDIRYRESEDDGIGADAEDSALGLKPLTEEFPLEPPKQSSASQSKQAKSSPATSSQKSKPTMPKRDDNPDALSNALDALAAESMAQTPSVPQEKATPKRSKSNSSKKGQPAAPPVNAAQEDDDDIPMGEIDEDDGGDIEDGMTDRVRQALRSQQRRPGEEDPLRSPLVLSLTVGAIALLLTGAIFYFIATRQTVQQEFDAAKAAYDENNFRGAIDALQTFELKYPKHDLAVESKRLRGLARVRQNTEGALPKFEDALNELRVFISEQRDLEEFELQHPDIMGLGRDISLGAAVAAGRQFDPQLLEISREARTIVKTYAPKDAPPVETLDQIEQALRVSEAQILKNDVYNQHIGEIDSALEGDNPTPLTALKTRRNLLVRYPEFERDKKVVTATDKILSTEKEQVTFAERDQAALAEDHNWPADSLTLAFQGRTRTDEVAVGKAVIATSQDCCYGVEFATGEPIWRRVIGFDTPFFPLLEESLPSVVLFDTNHLELVRVHQTTGQLVWRQPIGEFLTGEPLMTNDTIYAATDSGRLVAVDVETGALTGELRFSQPISGPVELKDEQRMLVAGNEEVVYCLTKRPLECTSVTYIGHAANSIQAPLVTAGTYVLLIENGSSTATLRLLETGAATEPAREIATAQAGGLVVDRPVIRGRDLFVPSIGERVSSYTLSNDPGQPPLTTGPVFQGEGDHVGAVYLMTAPSDQVWMATGALNLLQLTTDALQPEGEPVAPGIATQPLQRLSGYLFHARRRPFTQAVTLTRTDSQELTSDWQAILGGRLLAAVSREGGSLSMAAVNEAGHAFRIGDRQLAEGPFLTDAPTRLPLHPDLTEPLVAGAVSNDRIAVAAGGPEPRLWLINAAGQIEGSPLIPAVPQAAPESMGKHVLLPVEGRIHVIRQSGQSAVQDFALPTGETRVWRGVYPSSDDSAVAATTDGLLILLKYGQSPRPNLSEASRVELGHPISYSLANGEGLIAVGDASGTLTVFSGERLDPQGKRAFPRGLTNQPWIAGGRVYAEEGGAILHCLEPSGDLPLVWSADLEGASVAGVLMHEGQLLIARQNGEIWKIDPASGNVIGRQQLNNAISLGPFSAGDRVYVSTIDGTLIPLTL
ncbi:MAG: PQQ-binding-like beta-propeller repeat protein [Planctomycetaceae bacterium]|nr:PQQ-binding-like beta-propeller repeat protein [Planctomycetaceae bacterium]